MEAKECRGSSRVVVKVANSREERTGERKKENRRTETRKEKNDNRDKYHTRVGEKGKKKNNWNENGRQKCRARPSSVKGLSGPAGALLYSCLICRAGSLELEVFLYLSAPKCSRQSSVDVVFVRGLLYNTTPNPKNSRPPPPLHHQHHRLPSEHWNGRLDDCWNPHLFPRQSRVFTGGCSPFAFQRAFHAPFHPSHWICRSKSWPHMSQSKRVEKKSLRESTDHIPYIY